MATPSISLAMMSLMQTLAMDGSAEITEPRAILLKRLEEVAIPAADERPLVADRLNGSHESKESNKHSASSA